MVTVYKFLVFFFSETILLETLRRLKSHLPSYGRPTPDRRWLGTDSDKEGPFGTFGYRTDRDGPQRCSKFLGPRGRLPGVSTPVSNYPRFPSRVPTLHIFLGSLVGLWSSVRLSEEVWVSLVHVRHSSGTSFTHPSPVVFGISSCDHVRSRSDQVPGDGGRSRVGPKRDSRARLRVP